MILGVPCYYEKLLKDLGLKAFTPETLDGWLAGHLEPFVPFLGLKESRPLFLAMVKGLLGGLPRKTAELIADNYLGPRLGPLMNYFMSEAQWDDQGMLEAYRNAFADEISEPRGMLAVDVRHFPKAGNAFVGVDRQYRGAGGKLENAQAAVFLSYVGLKGRGLVDFDLYMPEKWFRDSFAAKRRKGGVPEGLEYKTRSRLALDLIRRAAASGRFQYEWVGCGADFGLDGDFLDGLPKGVRYFADVPPTLLVYPKAPEPLPPKRRGAGPKPGPFPATEPVTVEKAVEAGEIPSTRLVLGLGLNGPILAKDKLLRVVEVRRGRPGKDVWLYALWPEEGEVKYALCDAPVDAPIGSIRAPAARRWCVEGIYKEGARHFGMDHYELSSWTGWRRHMLLTLICHFFVTKTRLRFPLEIRTPMPGPYVDGPVDLDAYVAAILDMRNGRKIDHPLISEFPLKPQYVISFSILSKFLASFFPPRAEALEFLSRLRWNPSA